MSLKAKSALITGGASGIGFEVASLLRSRGWWVVLLDHNASTLNTACDGLPIDRSSGITGSVTNEADVDNAIGRAAEIGILAAVINCAGIAMDKSALDTSVDEFRRIVDVNLTGTFLVARAAARYWIATGQPGSIVNISSVSGMLGNKGRSAYGSSKGAVNQLTRILSTEFAPKGIRINAVAPGAIDTPMSRAVHTDDVRNQWHERIPQGRYGAPREIASAVAYLISDDASYVTGQILAVDGGFSTAGLMIRDTT